MAPIAFLAALICAFGPVAQATCKLAHAGTFATYHVLKGDLGAKRSCQLSSGPWLTITITGKSHNPI
jgi:hypothetical protein